MRRGDRIRFSTGRTRCPCKRTRRLIELGGLVAKADLIGDDSAVILGLLVEAAATLRGEGREQRLMLWRRRGKRALDAAKVE